MSRVIRLARASEWWEYKLAPVLGTIYAAALISHARFGQCVLVTVSVVVLISIEATFVIVINDATDREVDRLAGKHNSLQTWSERRVGLLIGSCVLAGLIAGALLIHSGVVAWIIYVSGWASFALYSCPPVRLKARGFGGVLADAAGAHVFPQLLGVALLLHRVDRGSHLVWACIVGVWALAAGMRGALWHQLGDVAADVTAGVGSFAARRPRRAAKLGLVCLPCEVALLVGILSLAHALIAILALLLYLPLELARCRLFALRLVACERADDARIAMQEYYQAFYPLALLVSLAMRDTTYLVLLVAQLILFPRGPHRIVSESFAVARRLSTRISEHLPGAGRSGDGVQVGPRR